MSGQKLTIDDEELARLIQVGEDSRVEFKEALAGVAPTRIREAICAFANDLAGSGQPGIVVVGLRDDKTPARIAVNDEMLRALTDMRSDGNIVPPPMLLAEKRRYQGNDIAVVTVLPSDSPPVRFRGVIHVRAGPRRGVANAQDERILNERRKHGNRPFDIYPVPGTGPQDLRRRQFDDEYLPNAIDRETLLANERSYSERLAAAKLVASVEDERATVLGLLVLGVRLTWFDNRIEIQNPGGPFGIVTKENFAQPGVTDYRNPNLAESMKVLGFVQRFGDGIPTAQHLLKDAGHPAIEFVVQPTHLLATVMAASTHNGESK